MSGIPIPHGLHLSFVSNLGRSFCAAYQTLKVIGNAGQKDLVLGALIIVIKEATVPVSLSGLSL